MRDYHHYQARRERDEQRAVQDQRDASRHREFSLSAQDQHHKFERAHFAVVGEGSQTAQENYRRGYDRIFASSGAVPAQVSVPSAGRQGGFVESHKLLPDG